MYDRRVERVAVGQRLRFRFCQNEHSHGHERRNGVRRTLGHKHWPERPYSVMVPVIERVGVFERIVDEMTMNKRPPRNRLMQVWCRHDRKREHCSNRVDRHADPEDSTLQQDFQYTGRFAFGVKGEESPGSSRPAPATVRTLGFKLDVYDLMLRPYEYVEYKYHPDEQGATLLSSWKATAPGSSLNEPNIVHEHGSPSPVLSQTDNIGRDARVVTTPIRIHDPHRTAGSCSRTSARSRQPPSQLRLKHEAERDLTATWGLHR